MTAKVKAQPMRERIVSAAIQVIRERGVTGATTKEIARAAGVAEGSLYNHFENKTALFATALGEVASGIRGAMMETVASVGRGTVEDNLTRLAAAAVRFYTELLPMTGSALANRDLLAWLRSGGPARVPGVPAPGEPGVPQGPVLGHIALNSYLEGEQQAGRLAADAQPPYLAMALLGACQQYAFLSLLTDESVMAERVGIATDIDEYARQIVRTVLAGHLPE